MADSRYHNLGWFARHPKLYEIGTRLLSTLRRQAAEAVGLETGMKVLDVACGTGALSYELAKLGYEVTGIDLDGEMLRHLTRKIRPGLRLSFVHADALHLPFDENSFQAVTISFSMHDIPYEIALMLLKESKRVLMPNGEITIIDYNEPQKNILARMLYYVAILYESPNYKLFVKSGLDKYFSDADLVGIRRFTIFGCVQVVTCKSRHAARKP
jgi:ubiquinone/menaquinone biosynthesis C-methylase UbiE